MRGPGLAHAASIAMLAALLPILPACSSTAPGPLYHWGGYQRQLYEYLRGDETTPTEQLTALQAGADRARAAGAALPPGFRAQLALLYLQVGRDEDARRMIDAERAAFPESAQYMDFVLRSTGQR